MKVFRYLESVMQLKEMVKEAVLEGEIPYTFEAADEFMRRKALEIYGLEPVKK